jgi:hypothetical protein
MHKLAAALSIVLVLGFVPAAHAGGDAAARATRAIQLREFRKVVRSSKSLAAAHAWNLTKAGAKAAGKGLVVGLIGTAVVFARPFITPPAALFPVVAIGGTLGAGVWSYRKDDLPAARTETVARGVAEGKIAPKIAKGWESADIINGDWR